MIVAGFLLSQFVLPAQNLLRFDDFLQQSLSEANTILGESKTSSTFKPSPVEEIQIRTETDRFDFNRQEYLLRIRPSTIKIGKAHSNYYRVLKEQIAFERTQLKEDFVEAAYDDWLDIIFTSKDIAQRKKLLILLEDQEKVENKLSQLPGVNVKDIIDIQKKMHDLKIEIFKKDQFLKRSMAENQIPHTSDLISIERIESIVNTSEQNTIPQNIQRENAFDLQLIEAQTTLEHAERHQYFDYIQFRYNGPHTDPFEEKLAVGLGFQLPFSSNGKFKLAELNIEKEKAREEFKFELKVLENRISKQKQAILLFLDERAFAQQLFEEMTSKSEELFKRASQEEGVSPILLLRNKEDLIEYDLEILNIEKSIYKEFIKLLILTGTLFEEPVTNQLSNTQ